MHNDDHTPAIGQINATNSKRAHYVVIGTFCVLLYSPMAIIDFTGI